jgi:ABC-type multidrug transport system ATPase subunit
MADLLEIDSVSYAVRDRLILKDVYLQLNTGKVTGLLGRNGSGKSSLMKILFGAMNAAHQSIRWNRRYVKSARKIPGLIAMCPQFDFLPPFYTISGIFDLYQVKNTAEILGYLGTPPETKVRALSGGKKRMLQVLLCLHLNRKFILLDEPFSQLAPVSVELISSVIQNKAGTRAY